MWLLVNLILYNSNGQPIVLPRTRELTVGSSQVYKEIVTADGTRKRYVIGYRPEVVATWDYFPADLLAEVTAIARSCSFFTMDYPGEDGNDNSGLFSVEASSVGVFAYRDGKPIWRGLTLTFSAQTTGRT